MTLLADVDLLVIEPSVFVDASAASTNLLAAADAALAGVTLTSASSDFQAAGIGSGHVAVVGDETLEIIQRLSETELEISRPRPASGESGGDKIAPPPAVDQTLKINTFARLIAQTQHDLLQALGVRSDDPDLPLDESAIVSRAPLARFIALRVIERAFSLAAAIDPDDQTLATRAAHYATLADELAESLTVLLDVRGEGSAVAARRLNVAMLTRG